MSNNVRHAVCEKTQSPVSSPGTGAVVCRVRGNRDTLGIRYAFEIVKLKLPTQHFRIDQPSNRTSRLPPILGENKGSKLYREIGGGHCVANLSCFSNISVETKQNPASTLHAFRLRRQHLANLRCKIESNNHNAQS